MLVDTIVPQFYPDIITGIRRVRQAATPIQAVKELLIRMIECSPRRALHLFHTATEKSTRWISAEVQDQVIQLLKIISQENPAEDTWECDDIGREYMRYWTYFNGLEAFEPINFF